MIHHVERTDSGRPANDTVMHVRAESKNKSIGHNRMLKNVEAATMLTSTNIVLRHDFIVNHTHWISARDYKRPLMYVQKMSIASFYTHCDINHEMINTHSATTAHASF